MTHSFGQANCAAINPPPILSPNLRKRIILAAHNYIYISKESTLFKPLLLEKKSTIQICKWSQKNLSMDSLNVYVDLQQIYANELVLHAGILTCL